MIKNYEKAKAMQPEALMKLTANADYCGIFTETGFVYRNEFFEDGEKKQQFLRISFDGKRCEEYPEGEKLFEADQSEVNLSPDGNFAVLLRDHNLWLRDTRSGKEKQITFDGELHYDYASRFEGDTGFVSALRMGLPYKPAMRWSPDSSKFVTYRLDQRKVRELNLIRNVPQDGTMRPVLYSYKYAMPGDAELPLTELVIYDVISDKLIPVDIPPMERPMTLPISEMGDTAAWSFEGGSLLYTYITRDYKKCTVYRIDPCSGTSKVLFTEESDTFLFFDLLFAIGQSSAWASGALREDGCILSPLLASDSADTLLWLSNRDGWYHVYNYSLSDGRLRNRVTVGEFEVTAVNRVDWQNGMLYFTACGLQKDPYDADLCAVPFSGGEMKMLTKGEGNHQVRVAPRCDCFVDFLSEADLEPVLTLRAMDGTKLAELLRCDAARAAAAGCIKPVRFLVPGADGRTPISGCLYLPEEAKKEKVPVIEYYYGGNQKANVPHTFQAGLLSGLAELLVQLGAAVVIIDGKGTPLRGKAFFDACYRNQRDIAGVEDHIAAIRQLAARYPLDIGRVGVFGHSGGGYAAFHCLTDHGEFYKCGVASGGNHVQEIYLAEWSERFLGTYDPDIWKKQDAEYDADKLNGPLLLIHGELDDNVHPANTMRLVDALIKANKDFELLIIPNFAHDVPRLPYWRRRLMDFFVRNLLGKEPPKEFKL